MLKRAAVVSVLTLAAGCGGGGTPERDSGAVSNEVATQSRAIMDMMQITGQLVGSSPPRGTPTDMSCDDDNDDSPERVMTQMWTLHAKDNTLLGKGMANLLAGLPKQGWKVVKNAPDSSRNRNQEILATHLATKTQIDVTWEKNIQYGDPLIRFDVFSRCFRTPSAT